MEEINKKEELLTVSPDIVDVVVDVKEEPVLPIKKVRILPWIVLGLVISMILAGGGYLVWRGVGNSSSVDLVINAEDLKPSETPVQAPVGESIKLVQQELLFEDKPYINQLARFQINVPLGWKIDDSGESGSVLVLVDPKVIMVDESAVLTFINISTGVASGETLTSYIEKAREGLVKNYDSYVIEEDKDMLVNGNSYHLIGGSYSAKGITIKNRNILLVFENRGYWVSATAPESVWVDKEMLINASIFSFKNF